MVEFPKSATEMELDEVMGELSDVSRLIRRFEWDKGHNQLNPAKLTKLEVLQKRADELKQRLEILDKIN